MPEPIGTTGVAFNQATASENKIHDDDVARRFGFRGGLVPGVTVYAYLLEPAIAAWGRPFLERGAAKIVLQRPLYDGSRFRVDVKPDGPGAYDAHVVDPQETDCAVGRVWLPEPGEEGQPPERRGDPPAPAREARSPATREGLERLRASGLGAIHLRWEGRGEMERTHRELADMHDLVRPDRGGLANPAFTLGLANWVLSSNVHLGPWIHVESRVQSFAAVPLGARVCAEARVVDLFARGGHEFVDLDVAVFLEDSGRAALRADHRAIYRLRETG